MTGTIRLLESLKGSQHHVLYGCRATASVPLKIAGTPLPNSKSATPSPPRGCARTRASHSAAKRKTRSPFCGARSPATHSEARHHLHCARQTEPRGWNPFAPLHALARNHLVARDPDFKFREKSLRYNRRMFEPAEAQFRRSMSELARRGGAATKKLAAIDRNYYASIGRLGGRASVAARKAKIAAEGEFQPADARMSDESAQASVPPAGPEAAEGAPVISQPVETGDGCTKAFSENYEQGRRIAELLAELLDHASDETPKRSSPGK
jgi:general stress protein YciG